MLSVLVKCICCVCSPIFQVTKDRKEKQPEVAWLSFFTENIGEDRLLLINPIFISRTPQWNYLRHLCTFQNFQIGVGARLISGTCHTYWVALRPPGMNCGVPLSPCCALFPAEIGLCLAEVQKSGSLTPRVVVCSSECWPLGTQSGYLILYVFIWTRKVFPKEAFMRGLYMLNSPEALQCPLTGGPYTSLPLNAQEGAPSYLSLLCEWALIAQTWVWMYSFF